MLSRTYSFEERVYSSSSLWASTVVPPPLTDTPVLAKLGFDPRTMPMKPMSVEQCVSEGVCRYQKLDLGSMTVNAYGLMYQDGLPDHHHTLP
jgi:hypothetical protein